MFTQAGFNERRRTVCYAVVARGDRTWRRPARLVLFKSGDYAWDGGHGRISWPEQLRICNHPQVRHAWVPSIDMPSEPLP